MGQRKETMEKIEQIELDKRIRYIPAKCDPLSADVGLICGAENIWLYDVGADQHVLEGLNHITQKKAVVLSHFHPDHIENLTNLSYDKLYVGDNTYKYTKAGTIVDDDIYIEDNCRLHIFKIPSCHAKGSLALEVDETYVFVGDALYPTTKKGEVVYNVQHLQEQIALLKKIKSDKILISHTKDFIYEKKNVIEQLEKIYATRQQNNPFISAEGK